MAGGYIQVPPDSTGKKMNARYRAIEGGAGYEQYVAWHGLPTFFLSGTQCGPGPEQALVFYI